MSESDFETKIAMIVFNQLFPQNTMPVWVNKKLFIKEMIPRIIEARKENQIRRNKGHEEFIITYEILLPFSSIHVSETDTQDIVAYFDYMTGEKLT